MKILSITTSSNICGVAILENDTLLKQINQDSGLTHSETLMPLIKSLFESLKLKLSDIDLIVCDKGPGSFTGIRIGIATAKAFSDSLCIPTIGISSLEGLSYNTGKSSLICTLIDARKNNCYWALFEKSENQYTKILDFDIENINNILNKLSDFNKEIIFVGDGSINYRNEITLTIPNSIFSDNNFLSAYNIGLAGYYKFQNKENMLQNPLLPMYLHKSQAEKLLDEKTSRKE